MISGIPRVDQLERSGLNLNKLNSGNVNYAPKMSHNINYSYNNFDDGHYNGEHGLGVVVLYCFPSSRFSSSTTIVFFSLSRRDRLTKTFLAAQ